MKKPVNKFLECYVIKSISVMLILLFFVGSVTAFTQIKATAAVTISEDRVVSYFKGRVNESYANGYCLRFVADAWAELGAVRSSACCAYNYGSSHIQSTSINNVPVGADVFFGQSSSSCSTCKSNAGHIGVYVGNDQFVHASGGKVQISSLSSWSHRYRGWGFHSGVNIIPVIPTEPTEPIIHDKPIGVTDSCEGKEGMIHIRGWAFDPKIVSSSIAVHVYIGGKVGEPDAEGHEIVANQGGRSDVNNIYHCGDYHAFEADIPTNKFGAQEVHVYALSADRSTNTPIGDFNVVINVPNDKIAIQQTSNNYYYSNIEKVEAINGNNIHVVGWVFGKSTPSSVSAVDIYIGGIVGTNAVVEGLRIFADVQRPDVSNAYKPQFSNINDKHGFDCTIPVNARGTYTLYFYAIDQTGSIPINPEIGKAYNVTLTDPYVIDSLPTDTPTEAPTQLLTETPTEAVTEAPSVTPTQAANELPTQEPSESLNQDAPQLKVTNKTTTIGSTIDVKVLINNNPGIAGMTLNVCYNSDVLTLTEIKDGDILGANTHKPELTSPYTLSWSNDTASENITSNGVIATLVFTVNAEAEEGDYPITLSYDYDNYDIYNVDIQPIKFETVTGYVSVRDIIYGDVNGDGKVNNIDRVYLTRYLSKWDQYQSINMLNSDVNSDGKVNNIDKIVLTRHLAKWDAYAVLPCQP